MAEPKLMIAARNKKGQIGYLSEGYSIPEFLSLIRPQNNINIMMDYSPIIDTLYKLHQGTGNIAQLSDYRNLYNYWREAKSFRKELVRMAKAEEICRMSSSLITKLQIGINGRSTSFYNKDMNQAQAIAHELRTDCNMYVDALLYYIHSKASLEIESFTRDSVVAEHGKLLERIIRDTYKNLIAWGSRGDNFLTYMVFERPDDAVHFLALEGKDISIDNYKLNVISDTQSRPVYDDFFQEHQNNISINYTSFNDQFINIALIFRDLLSKAESINNLIERLRVGDVHWDDSEESIQAVTDEISKTSSSNGLFLEGY